MRNAALHVFAIAAFTGPFMASAQQTPTAQAVQAAPVTKVLAIGHLVSPPTGNSFSSTMQLEVRDTVRLYLGGKIDQWYVRKDQNGVVFLINLASVEDTRRLLDGLPLVQAHLMQFDLIPLGPLSPLGLLLTDAPASAAQK